MKYCKTANTLHGNVFKIDNRLNNFNFNINQQHVNTKLVLLDVNLICCFEDGYSTHTGSLLLNNCIIALLYIITR